MFSYLNNHLTCEITKKKIRVKEWNFMKFVICMCGCQKRLDSYKAVLFVLRLEASTKFGAPHPRLVSNPDCTILNTHNLHNFFIFLQI